MEEVLDVFYNGYPEKVKEAKQKLNTFWHSDLKEQMIKEIGRNLVDCIYVSHSLEILSIIMTPFHAINTRYPTKEHNPLEYYNENLPLIQLFNELLEINEKTISKMEDILKFESLSSDCFQH